jgi:hypothetical protein
MSLDQAAVSQELARRQLQEEAANRDTAGIRRIAKGLLIAGWLAPIVPIVGFFGFFVSFWAGVGTGVYLMFSGARKSGLRFVLAGFFGTAAVGIAWMLVYLLLGIGGGFLSSMF